LGTITGNLDNNDEQEFRKLFEKVDQNMQKL